MIILHAHAGFTHSNQSIRTYSPGLYSASTYSSHAPVPRSSQASLLDDQLLMQF